MAKNAKKLTPFQRATQGLRRTFIAVYAFVGNDSKVPYFEKVQVFIDDKTKTPHLINTRTGREYDPREWEYQMQGRADSAREGIARMPNRSSRGGTAFGGLAYAFTLKTAPDTYSFQLRLRSLRDVADDLITKSTADYVYNFGRSVETYEDRLADLDLVHGWLAGLDC